MKRLKQLLKYSLVAVGTAMLTAGFTAGSVTSQVSNGSVFNSKITNVESSVDSKKTAGQPSHTISVTLSSPEDLKVKEGDRVERGDVVSDRTLERQRLEVKKQQLEVAIAQMSLPLTELSQLPEPNFDTELVALKKAKFKLSQATEAYRRYSAGMQFKESWMAEAMEPTKVEKLASLKQKEIEAGIGLEVAVARLSEAKTRYQQRKYQHSIQLAAHQTSLQRQQYQLASLVSQLQKVEDDLSKIVAVHSPYAGRVRRVRIIGQNERLISTEVTIDRRK